jgi:hypothetical protein
MPADADDGDCAHAEAAKNAAKANIAEHPQIEGRIGIADLRFGKGNPPWF